MEYIYYYIKGGWRTFMSEVWVPHPLRVSPRLHLLLASTEGSLRQAQGKLFGPMHRPSG